MVVCYCCTKEMDDTDTVSCDNNSIVVFPNGEEKKAVPYDDPGDRCYDCHVAHGGFHHSGCDMERCPKCGGQLISCGCLS